MAAQHYLIILLPEKSEQNKLCYEFWEDENIDEFSSACNTLQICEYFRNNSIAEDLLTDSFEEFTLDLSLNEILINLMSINHIAKTLLKPYCVDGGIIEEIIENGCEYGVSIIDLRNINNIRYCICLASYYSGEAEYSVLNIKEFFNSFSDLYVDKYSSGIITKEQYDEINNENKKVIDLSRNFETITENEVIELFPELFE